MKTFDVGDFLKGLGLISGLLQNLFDSVVFGQHYHLYHHFWSFQGTQSSIDWIQFSTSNE